VGFELVEFREPAVVPGEPFQGTIQTQVGVYDQEHDAIAEGRKRWMEHRSLSSHDVTWWIVRVPGESLARWIADGASADEQVLDLTTNLLTRISPAAGEGSPE